MSRSLIARIHGAFTAIAHAVAVPAGHVPDFPGADDCALLFAEEGDAQGE